MIDPNQKLFAHLELQQLSASQNNDPASELKNSLFKSFDGNTELKMKIKLARDNSFYFYPNMIQALHTARLLKFNKFSIQILNKTELKKIDLEEIKNSLSINIFVNFQSALQIFKLQGKEPSFEKKNEATINNDFVNISQENNYINICVETQIVNKNLAVSPFKLYTSKDHSRDFYDKIIRQMEVKFTLNGTKFKEKNSILLIDAKFLKDPNCKWLSDINTIQKFFSRLSTIQFKEIDSDKPILNQNPSLISGEILEKKEIQEHNNDFNKKTKIAHISSGSLLPQLEIEDNTTVQQNEVPNTPPPIKQTPLELKNRPLDTTKQKVKIAPVKTFATTNKSENNTIKKSQTKDLNDNLEPQQPGLINAPKNQETLLKIKKECFNSIINNDNKIRVMLDSADPFSFYPNLIQAIHKNKFLIFNKFSTYVFNEHKLKETDLEKIKKTLSITLFVNYSKDSRIPNPVYTKETEAQFNPDLVKISLENNYINICVEAQTLDKILPLRPFKLSTTSKNDHSLDFLPKVVRQINLKFSVNKKKFEENKSVLLTDAKSLNQSNCKWLTDEDFIQQFFKKLQDIEFPENDREPELKLEDGVS